MTMEDPLCGQLVVLSSELSSKHVASDLGEHTQSVLSEAGWQIVQVAPDEPLRSALPLLLLIATGGTEHQALEVVHRASKPVVLLVHRAANSLPAALEILACLQQQGRCGVIVPIDDDSSSRQQLGNALAGISASYKLRSARFGTIGGPSPWLVASSPGIDEVTSRLGCEVVTIAQQELIDAFHQVSTAETDDLTRQVQGQVEADAPAVAPPHDAVKIYLGLRRLVERHRLDGVTVRCFELIEPTGTTGCLALAMLNDDGIVAGCEGDLPALLTMYLLSSISGRPAFMANPQEILPADSTLWLAHCTVARSLCRSFHLDSHFESGVGIGVAGTLAGGPVTVARLGGADCSQLWKSEGRVVATGAAADRCRTQVRVKLDRGVGELLRRPLGNHLVLTPGYWAAALQVFDEITFGSTSAFASCV
jgi:L-fucose isomerase-like protein